MASRSTRSSSSGPGTRAPHAVPPTITNVTVVGAGLDTFVPVIAEVRESDITTLFKVKQLTAVHGRPTYESANVLEQELGRNALAIKVPFGGGKKGCLGVVYSDAKFLAEAGQAWTVPATQGSYPTFPVGATDQEKKAIISKFMLHENGIKKVETVEELLKNMFLAAIDNDYVVELKQGISEYDGCTLRELLAHYKKYGKMDDTVHSKIMETFREAPDLDVPVDKYFAKQEECQKLVIDTDNPINDAAMVLQLTQHLGKNASLSKLTVRFKKKAAAERTWTKGKKYFRDCIEELEDITKESGMEPSLQANAAVVKEEEIEDKVRQEIADKMSGSFDALASAAVAKSETLDNNATTIASLTKSLAQVIETNKQLTAQLKSALALCSPTNKPAPVKPPPGFPSEPLETLHIVNTAGVACPARLSKNSGKWNFVEGQHCNICKRDGQFHIPVDCFARPENAHKRGQKKSS